MTVYYVSQGAAGGGGGLSEGDPFTLAEATNAVVAGDKVWVKADADYTTVDPDFAGVVMDISVAGTATSTIEWEGYTTTPGDGGRVTIDAGPSALTYALNFQFLVNVYNTFKNFRFTGASSHGASVGTANNRVRFDRCRFDNNGNQGINANDYIWLYKCEIDNNSNGGANGDVSMALVGCQVHDNAGGASKVAIDTGVIFACVFFGNTGVNVYTQQPESCVISCTIDGEEVIGTTGISHNSTQPLLCILNNAIDGTDNGITFNNVTNMIQPIIGSNLFYSVSQHYTAGLPVEVIDDVTATSDPFTDSTAHDYTIPSGSDAQDAGFDPLVI